MGVFVQVSLSGHLISCMTEVCCSFASTMAEDRLFFLLPLVCLCSSAIAATFPDYDIIQCYYNHIPYKPGENVDDDGCNSLDCTDKGELLWTNTSCPEDCDPNSPQDPCCPPCQKPTTTPPETTQLGCEYNDTFYQPGELIYDDECYSLECSNTSCPEGCDPNSPQDPCCPPCQETTTTPPETTQLGCDYNDTFYQAGQVIYSNRCTSLQCSDTGDLIYSDIFCAEVCDPTFSPKECCPSCQDHTTTSPAPLGCIYQGEFYQAGQVIYSNRCTSLQCSDTGDLIYGDIFCAEVCDPTFSPKECCPSCQDPTTTSPAPLGCIYQGEFYQPSTVITDDLCSHCVCPETGGEIQCSKRDCTPCRKGKISLVIPGHCCPKCISSILELLKFILHSVLRK